MPTYPKYTQKQEQGHVGIMPVPVMQGGDPEAGNKVRKDVTETCQWPLLPAGVPTPLTFEQARAGLLFVFLVPRIYTMPERQVRLLLGLYANLFACD